MEDIYELSGLMQMYQATGAAGYGDRVLERINRTGLPAGKNLLSGREAGAYLFALRQTGKQEYRNAADLVFNRLMSGEEVISETAMRSMILYLIRKPTMERSRRFLREKRRGQVRRLPH